MTMIGALALDGWRGFVTIDAAMDGDVFLAYVRQELVPRLRPGDIVVMDNLNSHRNPDALAAIGAAGADVLFLPPYSPDFNPIENMWSKAKALIRAAEARTFETIVDAVGNALRAVTVQDCKGYFQNCRYAT